MGENGVLGSVPSSEWQPVRQKRRSRNLNHRDGSRSEEKKIDWKRVWDSDKRFVTFYFKNFPDKCNVSDLAERFKVVGLIRDIFIPNRKGRDGTQYGFVRFGCNIDKTRAEIQLNNIWLGSYKLRANLSKFERGPVSQVLRVEQALPKHNKWNHAWRKENISYASPLGGLNKPKETQKRTPSNRFASCCYTPELEDTKFLRNYFTGSLKEEHPWWEIGDWIT